MVEIIEMLQVDGVCFCHHWLTKYICLQHNKQIFTHILFFTHGLVWTPDNMCHMNKLHSFTVIVSQTWSSWKFSLKASTGSFWCGEADVRSSLSTPEGRLHGPALSSLCITAGQSVHSLTHLASNHLTFSLDLSTDNCRWFNFSWIAKLLSPKTSLIFRKHYRSLSNISALFWWWSKFCCFAYFGYMWIRSVFMFYLSLLYVLMHLYS